MSYTGAFRISLYALISAMELDMRHAIRSHINTSIDLTEHVPTDRFNTWKERYERDYGTAHDKLNISDIYDYLDFSDSYTTINTTRRLFPVAYSETIKNNTLHFEHITSIRNKVMHSRPLTLGDSELVFNVSRNLASTFQNYWTNLYNTLAKIDKDPSFVLGISIPSSNHVNSKLHNLPLPDFDETGLIGRDETVARIIKNCRGPYPVISIVGEGGVGKSAIALKVAYDILDDEDSRFDAIVWATSKTTQLSMADVREIRGAIKDSLGLFAHIADSLGCTSDDPKSEILEYMESFRILLFIDNLETILDDNTRSFIESIPSGSKVIITSRIGLGAYEVPIKLDGITVKHASMLARSLALSRNVSIIRNMHESQLSKYCERMQCNPGYIKWFVSSIQLGRSPEDIIFDPSVFLDFCMSNVYEYLSIDAKKLTSVMQCAPGYRTISEWALLYDKPTVDLQKAIQQLLTTNMLSSMQKNAGEVAQITYQLTELARSFLLKHHKVDDNLSRQIQSKRNKISSDIDKIDNHKDKYNPTNFFIRNKHDRAPVLQLIQAQRYIRNNNFAEAHKILDSLKRCAPDYFEVDRVFGHYYAVTGSTQEAKASYLSAISIAPKAPQLRFFYACFLNKYEDSKIEAIEQLEEALAIDKDSTHIVCELVRLNMHRMHFSDIEKHIPKLILAIKSQHEDVFIRRKAQDTLLQFYYRQADKARIQKDITQFNDFMDKFCTALTETPENLRDDHLKKTCEKAIYGINIALNSQDFTQKHDILKIFKSHIESIIGA